MLAADRFDDRYTQLRLLGRGGFGAVYWAWDLEMEREVAIKVLKPDLAQDNHWRSRFRQEATAVSKLQHPNITVVFDRGEFENQPYLVMEYLEGESLASLIDRREPLTDADRLALLEQLCDGLHYAHQNGIIHRDVKPVNVMVSTAHDGTSHVRRLKILDFGIAKLIGSGLSVSSGHPGFTPNYVSPEQIRGEPVDGRSDMFAVGAIAYELFGLKKPFVITSEDLFRVLDEVKKKIADEPHQPLHELRPDIDPEVAAAVDRALAKAPEGRFKDLADMRRCLKGIRERLERAPAALPQATIVFSEEVQGYVRQAQQALDQGNPTFALEVLEKACATDLSPGVRECLAPLFAAARQERHTHEAGPTEKIDGARRAIAGAAELWRRGDHSGAIRALQEFTPGHLVADTLREYTQAAGAIDSAERALRSGSSQELELALQSLDALSESTLAVDAVARLKKAAEDRVTHEPRHPVLTPYAPDKRAMVPVSQPLPVVSPLPALLMDAGAAAPPPASNRIVYTAVAAVIMLAVVVVLLVPRPWLRVPTTAGDVPPSAVAPAIAEAQLIAEVVDVQGRAVSGVTVALDPGGARGMTDADGKFVFSGLKAGTYRLAASGHGLDATTEVSLTSGDRSTERLTLKTAMFGAIPLEQRAANPAPQRPDEAVTLPAPPRPAADPSPPANARQSVATEPPQSAPATGGTDRDSEISRALTTRVRELLRERSASMPASTRIRLSISTRKSPFGRGLTADYVATVMTGSATRSFPGQLLGFAELTLQQEIIEKVAPEIVAFLAGGAPHP